MISPHGQAVSVNSHSRWWFSYSSCLAIIPQRHFFRNLHWFVRCSVINSLDPDHPQAGSSPSPREMSCGQSTRSTFNKFDFNLSGKQLAFLQGSLHIGQMACFELVSNLLIHASQNLCWHDVIRIGFFIVSRQIPHFTCSSKFSSLFFKLLDNKRKCNKWYVYF